MARNELASCLRSWRERVSPADAGLPSGGQRRVSGLRREEVAQLAGLSMDYLTRLRLGHAKEKHFIHPEVGELTLDCDDLTIQGSDLRLVVFSAAPGSPSARALELLGAIGLQRFVEAPAI